jgi:hypothetical protein
METEVKPEVLEVPAAVRGEILIAYLRARAANSEFRAVGERCERLIAKFDKDGELAAIIRQVGIAHGQAAQSQSALNTIIIKLQSEMGIDLSGFSIDPETGNLIKLPTPTQA